MSTGPLPCENLAPHHRTSRPASYHLPSNARGICRARETPAFRSTDLPPRRGMRATTVAPAGRSFRLLRPLLVGPGRRRLIGVQSVDPDIGVDEVFGSHRGI